MRGGFRYSFRKRSKKYRGKGVKSIRHKLSKSHKRRRSRNSKKSRKYRKSMRGGFMQALTPADYGIDGKNTIIASNQPHVGPNFNTSGGYGFKFSDPELGGSFQPNTQCEQY